MTAVLLKIDAVDRLNHLPLPPIQSLSPPTTVGSAPDRYVREDSPLPPTIEETVRFCDCCGEIISSATTVWSEKTSEYLCETCYTRINVPPRPASLTKVKSEFKRSTVNSNTGGSSVKKEKTEYIHHDYVDDDENKDNYYCRYCDTTWPLTYFKNRQQFGAHCSNCSRKRRPRDDPGSLDLPASRPPRKYKRSKKAPLFADDILYSGNTSYDEEEYHPPRSSNGGGSGSGHGNAKYTRIPADFYDGYPSSSPTSSFATGLLERLLNVVENKLVEVNELEMIRKELQVMKSELLQREDRRQSRLWEVKNLIVNGVSEFKVKLAEELAHKEDECKKELEDMREDMTVEFLLKERDIKNMLEGYSNNPNHTNNVRHDNYDLQPHLQQHQRNVVVVQQQLEGMRVSFERRLEEVKKRMGTEVYGMEQLVSSGITKCESNIQDLLSELSSELNYQLEEVRTRFFTLEKVIADDPRNDANASEEAK